MARQTLAELRGRIAELEATQRGLEAERARLLAAPEEAPPAPTRPPRWRGALGGVLVVLGLVAVPVAIAGDLAWRMVSDTDAFIAAFAPLADRPEVQDAVADAVVAGVVDSGVIASGVDEAIGSMADLDAAPWLVEGLRLFEGQIVGGIESLVEQTVDGFVASDAFETIWAGALRQAHAHLTRTLAGDPTAAVGIDGDVVVLELAPLVDAVGDALTDAGYDWVAQALPADLDASIELAEVAGLQAATTGYRVLGALGAWLPAVAAALLGAGLALVRARRGWGIAIGAAVLGVAVAFGVGLTAARGAVTGIDALPADAMGAVFDAATADLGRTLVASGLLGALILASAWSTGAGAAPTALRRALGALPGLARRRLPSRGAFGAWLTGNRVRLRWLVVAVAAVVLVFARPWTTGLVVGVAAVAALVVLAVESLRADADVAAGPAPLR